MYTHVITAARRSTHILMISVLIPGISYVALNYA